jgi:putative membrane protein
MAETINQWAVITIVLSGIALCFGVFFIRNHNREAHMRAMLLASTLATVFLVLYLTRLGLGYEKKYVGPEQWRSAYFTLLISHIILATLNLPLALGALWNAYNGLKAAGNLGNIDAPAARKFFNRHRAWVRWTVPVWLYVAVTGWIIYLVLGRYGEVVKG